MNDINDYYKMFLDNISYGIKVKKKIVKYLKRNYKRIDNNEYIYFLEILEMLKDFDKINLRISKEIINLINNYYNRFKYVNYDNFEDIKIYKLTIDEYIKNL